MTLEQKNNSNDVRTFAAPDLYLVAATSATLVIAITLALAGLVQRDGWDNVSTAWLVLSAMIGVTFGSMPVAMLGVGALAAISRSRAHSRNRLSLAAISILASVPGLILALAIGALCGVASS